MIEWLARRIFSWTTLREEVVKEVHFYDYLDSIMKDPESMETAASFYPDSDGYRGWSKSPDTGKYYYNDVPEDSLMDAMLQLEKIESSD